MMIPVFVKPRFDQITRRSVMSLVLVFSSSVLVGHTVSAQSTPSPSPTSSGLIPLETLRKVFIGNWRGQFTCTNNRPFELSLSFQLVRDKDGIGLGGSVSEEWLDCHEIRLTRVDGARTDDMPPLEPNIAFGMARIAPAFTDGEPVEPAKPRVGIAENIATRSAGSARTSPAGVPNDFIGKYFLNFAADQGNVDAKLTKAMMLSRGLGGPRDDAGAAMLLRELSGNDARAQSELARMVSEGRGAPIDAAEGARLAKNAGETIRAALSVCTSQKGAAAIWELIGTHMRDPNRRNARSLMRMFTDIDFDPGTFLIESVRVEGVRNLQEPFRCVVRGRLTEARLTDVTRHIVTTEYDRHGVAVYSYDNSFDRSVGMAATRWFTESMRRTPTDLFLEINPTGLKRYRFILLGSGVLDSGPRYAADVATP